MGVFPLVARVGCLRGGAIRLLEEWSPIAAGVDRTRLTDPLAFSLRGEVARRAANRYPGRTYGQGETIERLGISALARLRHRARGGAGAPVRPPRLRGAGRPARAQIAEQPRALVFLRAPRRRVQSQLELFRRPDRRGRGRRARPTSGRAPTPSPAPPIMAGAAPATAAAAATRCARSTCSSSRRTPISRRSRPPSAASPRPTIPTSSRATRRPPTRFQMIQASYDVLRRAEERRVNLTP